MADQLDTAQAAEEIGTDPRTLRKFLRSNDSPLQPVGQGARYVITDADIPELKEKFNSWKTGKRASSNSLSKAPKSSGQKRGRSAAALERVDPLETDDIVTRLTHTIADRQRLHGVICNHSWPHPKVKGLTVRCTGQTVKGTRFCKFHPQLTWCGGEEPKEQICGPDAPGASGHPYCRYHAGDISEDEFNELLLDNPNADLLA